MTRETLFSAIQSKRSYLCVGLDPSLAKLPTHLKSEPEPLMTYLKALVDETHDIAVAYKPNTAFFECMGSKGWDILEQLAEYLPKDTFNIADAKRGDIGNTATCYAAAFFEALSFDAVTINPLMGEDTVTPFFDHEGKWAIILALTSNPGASDFLLQRMTGWRFYQRIMLSALKWGTPDNTMFVVGGTNSEPILTDIRSLAPEHFFLVPGIGAQGGSLEIVSKRLLNNKAGILVNASRTIMYASDGKDYAQAARKVAQGYQEEMSRYLDTYVK